ncbi:uracil-DNA glycosylase family protein [Rhizobium sp. CNPSo 4039]|uniref:uracil-DNA glycosylase family protein n=1 Tax=Rhizobium sp. CNPSo 4039 TaxID=3021409 RepID=UPI00254F284C|nr:uracil-DNA glycosylase family protein [Rhizobium sp. CNPSo 4039]MDK4712090.1 uracil-DNA glycosylase family protein [Rhizobium sp. CNPSo 4039]
MKQESELQILRSAIAACRLCRDAPVKGETDRLPHEPRPVATLSSTARILIAGQAPGLRVHESGLPFNDASGDRLRQWLAVDRESFYNPDLFAIMGMGFCFPGYDKAGSDLPPRKECAPLWRQRAMDAMPQIELILTIGQYAQAWHLGAERMDSMTETVAQWRRYLLTNRSPSVLPLPHPSWRNSGWLKRNPWFEAELLPVLQQCVKSLLP